MHSIPRGPKIKEDRLWHRRFNHQFAVKGKYFVNTQGMVDVNGDVQLLADSKRELPEIPVPFGVVSGNFSCQHCMLEDLYNSPMKVGGDFNCSSNQLTSLKWATYEVQGSFICVGNNITTMEGGPQKVGSFKAMDNQIKDLKGWPSLVKSPTHLRTVIDLRNNDLQNLDIAEGRYYPGSVFTSLIKDQFTIFADDNPNLWKWIVKVNYNPQSVLTFLKSFTSFLAAKNGVPAPVIKGIEHVARKEIKKLGMSPQVFDLPLLD